MKRLLAGVVSLLVVAFVFADVNLAKNIRVPNIEPGYCAWVSLEMCCRHQEIEAGYGLAANRMLDPDTKEDGELVTRNVGTEKTIADKLEALGIKFKMTEGVDPYTVKKALKKKLERDPDNDEFVKAVEEERDKKQVKGKELIRKAMKENRPVTIGLLTGWPTCNGGHAVVLLSFDEKEGKYSYCDPNKINKKFVANMAWFNEVFSGFAVVLEKEGK